MVAVNLCHRTREWAWSGASCAVRSSPVETRRRSTPTHEALWSRLLATAGVVVGFMAKGAYIYGLPQPMWLAELANSSVVVSIAGYTITLTPGAWRAIWAD